MKRLTVILLLFTGLLPFCVAEDGRDGVQKTRPGFVCALGWGSVMHIHQEGYSLYVTPDKYLAENFVNEWKLSYNATFVLRAGVEYGRMELYAYTGYRGYAAGTQQIPSGLRAHVFLGKKRQEGCFAIADSSVGIPLHKGEIHSVSAMCGAGYRFRPAPSFAIDYSLLFNYCQARPNKVTDPISGQVIGTPDIRNAFVRQFGLGFGIALVF